MTREAIIGIASGLFQRRGYHVTGLEEVARELSVTRPALYHYFKSKQELLFEIHRTAQKQLLAASGAIYALDLPPRELIRRLLYGHVMAICEDAELVACMLQEESGLTTRRRNEIRKVRTEYTAEFARAYEAGVKRGELAEVDPMLAAFLMLGACNWIAKWYRPGTWRPEEIAEAVSTMLLDGMRRPSVEGGVPG